MVDVKANYNEIIKWIENYFTKREGKFKTYRGLEVCDEFDPDTSTIIYDQKKIAAIRSRKASNLVECQGCPVLYHCAGACLGEAVNETGRLLGVKKDYCEAIRFLAKHMPLNAGLFPYIHP